MKIGEAYKTYSSQIHNLWDRKIELSKRQKELSKSKEKKEELEGVTLELSSVNKDYNSVHEFMEQLSELKMSLENAAAQKQQGEAGAEAVDDLAKYIETARRIASGAKVPSSDVKKLMEYSPEMYMSAMNAAAMNKVKSHKEYDSLWDDEENGQENNIENIDTQIDEKELSIDTPELSE